MGISLRRSRVILRHQALGFTFNISLGSSLQTVFYVLGEISHVDKVNISDWTKISFLRFYATILLTVITELDFGACLCLSQSCIIFVTTNVKMCMMHGKTDLHPKLKGKDQTSVRYACCQKCKIIW